MLKHIGTTSDQREPRGNLPWLNGNQRDALDVIANPRTTHSPALRMMAWAMLKTARGQRFSQSQLCRMHPCLKAQVSA